MAEETPGTPEPIAAPSPSETPQSAPAPAPESAGSTTTTQPTNPNPPDATATVDFEGMDKDAYARLRDQLLEVTEAPPGETPQAPATETTPPATAPSTEEEEPEATPTPGEEDASAVPGKGFRPRLGDLPDVEKEAIQLRRSLRERGQDVPLAECIRRTEAKYAPVAAGTPAAETPAAQAEPSDPDAIRERIKQMRTELKAAGPDADTVRIADLTLALDEARDELQAAEAAQIDAGQRLRAEVTTSRQKARSLYPALTEPNSPLSQRWSEVYDRLEANSDPLITSANPAIPLIIAQMAAAELGIAPANPARPAPKAPSSVPAKTTTPPASPVQVGAPGSLRSTAPANPAGQLETRLQGVRTTDDYEKLKEELFQVS